MSHTLGVERLPFTVAVGVVVKHFTFGVQQSETWLSKGVGTDELGLVQEAVVVVDILQEVAEEFLGLAMAGSDVLAVSGMECCLVIGIDLEFLLRDDGCKAKTPPTLLGWLVPRDK